MGFPEGFPLLDEHATGLLRTIRRLTRRRRLVRFQGSSFDSRKPSSHCG